MEPESPQPETLTVSRVKDKEPVCPTCGTPANVGLMRTGAAPGDKNFGKLVKCPDRFHQEARDRRLQKVSQLGPEDVKVELGDIKCNAGNGAMLRAAGEALRVGFGWFYFWGGPGNAKTEVLKAIVNEMNRTGRGPAIYTTFGRLLMWMRQAYGDKSGPDEMARFDELVRVRVLAIDEMDKPRETDWMMDFRFQFLDARYNSAINRETLTLYAGNPNPEKIFDEVIFDRFRDGRFLIVENSAESGRPAMRWQEA